MAWWRKAAAWVMALLIGWGTAHCAVKAADSISGLFINVGSADAAVFFLGEKTYLVDTGTRESVPNLLTALRACRVARLWGVMITHPHSDHLGGLKALLKSGIQVDHLYAPAIHNEKSNKKHPVYKAAKDNNIPITWLSVGDVILVEDQYRFTVLGPIRRDEEDENNNSLVLRLQTPEGSMLLTGDMLCEEENDLIQTGSELQAEVLKVGHHGKDDASGAAFLARVKPTLAVVSTGSEKGKAAVDAKVIRALWDSGASMVTTQDADLGLRVTLSGGEVIVERIN